MPHKIEFKFTRLRYGYNPPLDADIDFINERRKELSAYLAKLKEKIKSIDIEVDADDFDIANGLVKHYALVKANLNIAESYLLSRGDKANYDMAVKQSSRFD